MVRRLGKVAGVVSDKPWAWIKANYDNNKDLTRERKRLRERERGEEGAGGRAREVAGGMPR